MIIFFNKTSLIEHCNRLSNQFPYFNQIISQYGFPPFFKRKLSYETIVLIILEQQVSLASARAAFNKLKEKAKSITPQNILALNQDELRACYVSKQKAGYIKNVATAILNKSLNLQKLPQLNDDDIRKELIKIKGIGNWTADIVLMMCLHRCDCFPLGDVALITSIKTELNLPKETTKQEIEIIADTWKPNRTIAAFMLWWSYINKRNMVWK